MLSGKQAKISYNLLKKIPKEAVVIGGIAAGSAALIYLTKTNHGRANP